MKKLMIILFLFFFYNLSAIDTANIYHYYCSVSDKEYFHHLISLIGSIHEVEFNALDEIAVFDIGLSPTQRALLEKIEKLKIYEVEQTNPDIFKHFVTAPNGRKVRGWFSWKPVIIKQASELFPYFLYLDAGTLVLKPLDSLFKHIKQNGFFLMTVPHSIEKRITKPVIDKIVSNLPEEDQNFLSNPNIAITLDAGILGISKDIYQTLTYPCYQHTSDITLFADDGSSKLGFGGARHDQTILSIYALLLKKKLNPQGWSFLEVDEKKELTHIHYNPSALNSFTIIFRCRGAYKFFGDKSVYIHWKH